MFEQIAATRERYNHMKCLSLQSIGLLPLLASENKTKVFERQNKPIHRTEPEFKVGLAREEREHTAVVDSIYFVITHSVQQNQP